jgi:hypothetical protein
MFARSALLFSFLFLASTSLFSGNLRAATLQGGPMRKKMMTGQVRSKPTMCLGCHLVVSMTHASDADPVKGAWECPNCGHKYPFAFWKIRKQSAEKPKKAA